ncbi:hypothetical protein PAMP_002579 [Pampus punctatissimus]
MVNCISNIAANLSSFRFDIMIPGRFTVLCVGSERHNGCHVGSFPSTPNCSLCRTENCAVLGQHGQTRTLLQPRLHRVVVVDFMQPHSEQTSPSNQSVIDGLAARLASAVVHTFPRRRLHEEMISVILASPHPPLFNHSSFTTSSLFPAFLSGSVKFGIHLLTLIFPPRSPI